MQFWCIPNQIQRFWSQSGYVSCFLSSKMYPAIMDGIDLLGMLVAAAVHDIGENLSYAYWIPIWWVGQVIPNGWNASLSSYEC